MNPDLAMGDELLKKTGAGNLFMVFGEPDVRDHDSTTDGQIVVEIKGVDVYDPTTGQIRSASTDDIACWFIDTDYNGESFFVRHAYFTGADEPYDKLKRALRAEIDEAAWSSLYSTASRPFDPPDIGQDRREGHQPLRRRGAEGLRRLAARAPRRAARLGVASESFHAMAGDAGPPPYRQPEIGANCGSCVLFHSAKRNATESEFC